MSSSRWLSLRSSQLLLAQRHLTRLNRSSLPASVSQSQQQQRHYSSPKRQAKAVDETESTQDVDLPFLQRPLGVADKPTIIGKTWEDKRAELLDQGKRMEKRRHLVKEATKGYFADFNALRNHGGKTWIAPERLIRADQALYFPNIEGTTLLADKTETSTLCQNRVSVVGILGSQMSELHINSFTEETNSAFLKSLTSADSSSPPTSTSPPATSPSSPDPLYQYILINLQQNPLKSLLVKLFLSSLRNKVPEYLHSTYLVSSQNIEYEQEAMGLTNKHIGYVFLVDGDCKIRWAGCGMARPEESAALRNCTRVLLGREKQRMEAGANQAASAKN